MGLLNQVYLTNDLINWADWLNDIHMLNNILHYSASLISKCLRPLQLYLARIFMTKFPMGKIDHKIGFFCYFWKFCHWFLLEKYLNKNWYCLEFDLTGCNLGFTTRFWISMTELLLTMNSFMIGRNENQWIYQWIYDIQVIWKLSDLILLRIIVFELF